MSLNDRTHGGLCAAVALAGLLFMASPALAKGGHGGSSRACSATAKQQLKACHSETFADYHTKLAFCANETEDRWECRKEARAERWEAGGECADQFDARKALCHEIGEAPYAPEIDPEDFQDPRNPTQTNPYFPLTVGNRWVYEEDGEIIDITILDATKRIAGIDCIVYRDIVTSDGLLVEDTDDWFGLRNDGEVIYCGEEVKDYEYFEGDDPAEPELTAIDGRFKIGVDLAKSGTVFMAQPVVGTSYRQEWDPGNAEDIGTVLSTTYAYGTDEELDEFVPQAIAELMCSDADCVVIADRSTLDPGAFERKYYARGIGKFLEVKPEEGEFVPLVECNFDSRCDSLPVED